MNPLKRVSFELAEIYDFWKLAHEELRPGNGGHGSASGERTLGINISALSWIAGDDILKVLHSWEVIIRAERHLTPPAMVERASLNREIRVTVDFALAHLEWSSQQDWFGDYAEEIHDLHQMGKVASRHIVEKAKFIPCPADDKNGQPCGQLLKIRDGEMMEIVRCRNCQSEWTAIRLMAVALADSRRQVWLDAEAISEYLGIAPKAVQVFAKRHEIGRRGQLLNLTQFLAARRI
jgi:hypothetical protein